MKKVAKRERESENESENDSERESKVDSEREKVKIKCEDGENDRESDGENDNEHKSKVKIETENDSERERKPKIEDESERIKIESESGSDGKRKHKVKVESERKFKIEIENEDEGEGESEDEDEDENEGESDIKSKSETESEDDEVDWPEYRWKLLKTLQSVRHASSYAYGRSLHEFCLPSLNVHGVGLLSLPLCEHHVKAIIARCSPAPFGRGEETILDPTVRNTWQLSPTEFTIENEDRWGDFVDTLTEQARLELGFTGAIVKKKLYKLLVYEQGGFFLPHRDSEKDNGMFASLIIILPSDYEGGQLVVRHNGNEKEFDFGGNESRYTINYAAFYTDCEHEVRTVTQGYRLCLVYNIINIGQKLFRPPSDDSALIKQTADIIQQWESDPDGPIKLVYLLEHQYTPSSLSFRNLKGHDREVARLVKQMHENADVVAGLANLKWNSKGYTYGDDDVYWEIIDVIDEEIDSETMIMKPVVDVDDHLFVENGEGIFTQDEVLNKKLLTKIPHEDQEVTPTGNEGTEVERQYQATGLVISPKKNWPIMRWDLMGAELSIKKLAAMTATEGVREQVLAFLKSTAIESGEYSRKLLPSLRRLRLVDIYLDALKKETIRKGHYHAKLSSEIVLGCSEIGWTELSPIVQQYVDNGRSAGEIADTFRGLAFLPVPNDNQQRQSRSDLLDYTLTKLKGKIGDDHSCLPTLIEGLHHLGNHSAISEIMKKLAAKTWHEYQFVGSFWPIIKATHKCLSCDSFEASIRPYLVTFIKQAISIINKQAAMLHPAYEWEHDLKCKCVDCEKVKTFARSPTAKTEQLTVDCNNWENGIKKWANVKVVQDTVKGKKTPVAKKQKTTTKRTIILTKVNRKLSRWETDQQKQNQNIMKYLQSLPYYHATETK